eukprot:GEMP01039376.1.p1 GENE.GEMP01039376.1~~GEMP01039376.1.p1  ORF type:complete len:159 (-),score=27.38 GEMP01039376.1:886-1362(-)
MGGPCCLGRPPGWVVCWGAQNLGVYVGSEPLRHEKCERKTITLSTDRPPSATMLQELREQNIAEEVHRVGGCGKKMLNVILGKADAVIQLPGSYRWDICAGEALIDIAGGRVLSMDGEEFLYDNEGDMQNNCGMIAAKDPALLQQMIPITKGKLDNTA